MKQKDLALIIVIMVISAVISVFASKILFAGGGAHQQKVEVVQPITADFPLPDTRYFNAQSINPTQVITIGNNSNQDPFSANQQ